MEYFETTEEAQARKYAFKVGARRGPGGWGHWRDRTRLALVCADPPAPWSSTWCIVPRTSMCEPARVLLPNLEGFAPISIGVVVECCRQ